MSSIRELTPQNFDATVEQEGIVLVDAWAGWCGPCRQFVPVFEQAAGEYPAHVFAKLDTEAHTDLAKALRIEHIPTLMIYRDGILLYNKAGTASAEVLADLIAQVAALDMAAVRADVESDKP